MAGLWPPVVGIVRQMTDLAPSPDASVSAATQTRGFTKALLFAAKLAISALCLWLALRRIDIGQVVRVLPSVDYRWAAFAVVLLVAQIPLMALRLRAIVAGLGRIPERLTYSAANALTAICNFLSQVLPGFVGEGIRAWLLVRFGCSWREALTSVTIDRCVGIGTLIAFTFVILLLPSSLTNFSGYRTAVLAGFGGALIFGFLALIGARQVASLLRFWRYFSWLAGFCDDAHRVLFGPQAGKICGAAASLHTLTIVAVWALTRALGLPLSAFDAAVLFALMVGVGLIPITVGGWGLRELAVVSVFGGHGIAPELGLLLSLCFGAIVVVSVLPGAVVWLFHGLPLNRTPV